MGLNGEEKFEWPCAPVWQRLTNLALLAKAVPGLESVERVDSEEVVCRVRPNLAFLTSLITLTFRLVEAQPQERLVFEVEGKSMGTTVLADISLQIEQKGEGTVMHWKGEIKERTGLLKPISDSLIEAAALKIAEGFWKNFRKLEGGFS